MTCTIKNWLDLDRAARGALLAGVRGVLLVACWPATALLAQGYSPAEAVSHMTVAEGLEVSLVAAEPLVRQPVAIDFDDRGRLWVIQYLQYPNPADLKRVKVDRYSRTQYDRVPDPPPRGPRGADRLTILEDTDGDGRADRAKDFVDGLNLASGFAFGHGGVFVLNVPYLLFYSDRDRDDRPDGDPEVLLSGFGMEDAHSVANSLTWGPDGWLYGTQGSTVTANIRGIEFQQGVWRYHPTSRRFELFCEGGGNSWGLDFDSQGELLYSTNLGNHVLLHGVQGAYYWKSFGKHGALHNQYAFGYFDHAPHQNFSGGHVTVGGVAYQGDGLLPEYRGRYIAGDLLGHAVNWHSIAPRGSTFATAHGGALLQPNDTWFAPSDVTVGPDGAIYIADWHDARTAHPDPDAEWDRTNGRVYRIRRRGLQSQPVRDLRDVPSTELVGELSSTNDWYVRRARLRLAERRDASIVPALEKLLADSAALPTDAAKAHLALEALWALHATGGLSDAVGLELLTHPDPAIRSWTVRLLGDAENVSPAVQRQLPALAAREPSIVVRRQLACTARRLAPPKCLAIVSQLWTRDEDFADPYLPLLDWWALEPCAIPQRQEIIASVLRKDARPSKRAREFLLPRLVRRYALEMDEPSSEACVALLLNSQTETVEREMLIALDEALASRGATAATIRAAFPAILIEFQELHWESMPDDPLLLRLALRYGSKAAERHAIRRALDTSASTETRLAMLQVLAQLGQPESLSQLAGLLTGDQPDALRAAALQALARGGPDALAAILAAYPGLSPELQSQARDRLLARRTWAAEFLARIDQGQFDAKLVPLEQLRVVASHGDPALDALVHKHWGAIHSATPEERLAVVRRLNNDLRAADGNTAAGQMVYKKQCATCHTLFGQGEKIGPDLTHANRQDRDFLLRSIVDPSVVVRKEFANYTAATNDGRIVVGLIAEQDDRSVTLLTAKNERVRLARSDLTTFTESPISLMPDNIAEQLSPQELRDLFAWLQRSE